MLPIITIGSHNQTKKYSELNTLNFVTYDLVTVHNLDLVLFQTAINI